MCQNHGKLRKMGGMREASNVKTKRKKNRRIACSMMHEMNHEVKR